MKTIVKKYKILIGGAVLILLLTSLVTLHYKKTSHQEMLEILANLDKKNKSLANEFSPEAKYQHVDSLLHVAENSQNLQLKLGAAALGLKVGGKEEQSVKIYEDLLNKMDPILSSNMLPDMAIAYMRLGERSNCMRNHTGSSCIFPIKDNAVHTIKTGSKKAIQVYQAILAGAPKDLESKWLLNIAFMTLGEYPQKVPKEFLIPGLNADTGTKVKPFKDVAGNLGLDIDGRAGGVIIEDFNQDNYLDIVVSGWALDDQMHYFENNKDGSFTDRTAQSGLIGIKGGLNIQQTDYNNDGLADIFVLRGAWLSKGFGNQPCSLLRNNGDGTFADVTTKSGLLSYHPSQAATWADFNNDGWLDVFIGREDLESDIQGGIHTCALYMNNHDGTFRNVAAEAHCDITAFVKGVTSADYDHDGWTDIFISTMNGRKYLLKNKGSSGSGVDFDDVSEASGVGANKERTFGTWFFDYNNDGWQDIVVNGYNFTTSLAYYAGAEAIGQPVPKAGNIFLYRNNHDGTFTEVTNEMGLNKVVFAMGCNFGDIDNDGYPDMYFGTGNPDFKSLVPNKLFKNMNGQKFADVTTSSRTGNLQKGHGVAFADFRNVGLQDIYIEMGGAFKGDGYKSSLYENPGQNNNNWINLKLEGIKANKAAIGSHIKLTFIENGVKRSVYKDVNSGGSFGSSPLRQEIGIGQASLIDEIEIKWAGSGYVQHFKHVKPNQFLTITEGDNQLNNIHLTRLTYKTKKDPALCMPMPMSAKLN